MVFFFFFFLFFLSGDIHLCGSVGVFVFGPLGKRGKKNCLSVYLVVSESCKISTLYNT